MGYAQLLPFPEILGHITVEEQEEKSDEQEDLHQHSLCTDRGVCLLLSKKIFSRVLQKDVVYLD